MTRRGRVALKVVAWAACLAPLGWVGYRAWGGDLTANPISFLTNTFGDWTLRILLASLAVTPLRILFRWSWPIALRRLLGLFAFFYATLHFSVWLVLTVGMAALVLMIPLAATSTAAAIRRMGGARWQWLHRVVYVIGVCAVLHYLWLAKKANPSPYYYAVVLGLLLTIRVGDWVRRAVTRTRVRAAGPSPRPSPQRGEGA